MARAVFVQDYKGKNWFDISGDANPAKENSILKEYLILDYSAAFNRQCLMVWDGEEKRFYEVAKGEKNTLVTTEGKELSGIFICGKGLSDNGGYRLPVRWSIEQRNSGDTVTVTADIANLEFNKKFFLKKDGIEIIRPYLSWEKTGWKINLAEGSFQSVNTAADNLEAPLPVINTLFRILLDDAEFHFKRRPVPRCEVTGIEKIRAFIDRPFDLNIAFARNYQTKFYEQDFVRESGPKHNFRLLCTQMGLFDSEELENLYYREPYAVHYRWVLKYAGFKDEKVITALMSRRDFWDVEYKYHTRNFNLSEKAKEKEEGHRRQNHGAWIGQEEIDALLRGDEPARPLLERNDREEETEKLPDWKERIYNDRHAFKGPGDIPTQNLQKDSIPYNLVAANFADCVWLRYYYNLYTSLRSEWELAK